jgi:hypothetical protein
MAAAGKTTTILNSGFNVNNILTLGDNTGTITDGASSFRLLLNKNGGTPLVTSGATIDVAYIHYMPSGTLQTTIAGTTYNNYLELMAGAASSDFILGGDVTCGYLLMWNSLSNLAIGSNTLNVTANASNPGTITISTGTLDIDGNFTVGTLTATGAANIYIGGNWSGVTSFTPSTSTVTFTGNASANQTVTTAGQAFYHFTVNNTQATYDDVIISGALDVNGTLTITDGQLRLDTNNPAVNTAGAVSIGASGTVTKGTGTWTFDGTTATTYTDSTATPQNIGVVAITKTSGTPSNNKVTLASSMTVDTLTISANNTLDLASAGYTLTLANAGATATVFTNSGTLTPGTSTVKYSATNSGGNINVVTTTYNSLQLSGAETYVLTGNLTSPNNLTGTLTIDLGAILDTVSGSNYNITLAGNWSNSGTFTANTSTVTFTGNASANQTVTTAGQAFYHFTVNNTQATYDDVIISGNLDVDGTLTVTDGQLRLDTNNPNVNIAGNLSIASGATWTKGSGTLTFDGTGSITDSNTVKQDLGAVAISNNSTRTQSSAVKMTSLTIGSGSTYDLAGYDFAFSSLAAVSNSGALKLHGDETLTNVSGFGTSAGVVDYYGSTYSNTNIFSGYYTLTLSGTGTFIAPLNLTIYGDFNHTGGTFGHNNGTVTFAGTNQSITGDNTFYNITKTGTGVLTFPGNNTQTIRRLATFRGTGIGNLLTLNKDANGTRWNINITSDRYDFIYLDVYNSNNLGIIIYAPQSFVTGCIGWEGRARPVPIPTPTQNKCADATNENNIIMNDAVAEARSILNVNEGRIERVQQRIISYIAALQKIMVPPLATGLKVMVDGERIYIGQ